MAQRSRVRWIRADMEIVSLWRKTLTQVSNNFMDREVRGRETAKNQDWKNTGHWVRMRKDVFKVFPSSLHKETSAEAPEEGLCPK